MKYLTLIFLALLLFSCSKEIPNDEFQDEPLEDLHLEIGNESFYFQAQPEGYYLHNFDEIYHPEDIDDFENMVIESQRAATYRGAIVNGSSYFKWPCNRIYYKFDSSVSSSMRTKITTVFSGLENRTKLDFKPAAHSAPRSTYVFITQVSGSDGAATVGKTSNPGFTIGGGASPRTILHEIGHVVGLHHEHQRSDGEDFLDYFLSNAKWKNRKWIKPLSYAVPHGTMDFTSVMMYYSCLFSKDGGGFVGNCDSSNATHLTNTGSVVSVNRAASDYSSADLAAINAIYNTNVSCSGGGGSGGPINQ